VPADETTNIYFEKKLKAMRLGLYRHPPVDILKDGFRPVGSRVADFAVIHHAGREHFFYIDRRIQEGTPFFPGHEIFFGHASTADFFDWLVHDPVMLIRPGTWEGAHVWAPFVLRDGNRFVMAYTGLNDALSQDIGLAFSTDLFDWTRWEHNPISPCRNASWAAWWPDEICSCRDPYLLRHEGRIYMTYTANTRAGASCVALSSSTDFVHWQDHGPILVGPASGYEPSMWGGHSQGSCESTVLVRRAGRWFLIVGVKIRDKGAGAWVFTSDRMDRFDFSRPRHFWHGGIVEVVRDDGNRSLVAGGVGGGIKFGEVDWSRPEPAVQDVSREQLIRWQSCPPRLG
jgi:beta-fructofuranosidase